MEFSAAAQIPGMREIENDAMKGAGEKDFMSDSPVAGIETMHQECTAASQVRCVQLRIRSILFQ